MPPSSNIAAVTAFWQSNFGQSHQVEFDDFVAALTVHFNEEFTLPLHATVDAQARELIARGFMSAEWERAAAARPPAPALVNATLLLFIEPCHDCNWHQPDNDDVAMGDSDPCSAVTASRAISLTDVTNFVQCFGPAFESAFLTAHLNLFDEQGALYPWFHGRASEDVDEHATGFRARVCHYDRPMIIAEEFASGQLMRQFYIERRDHQWVITSQQHYNNDSGQSVPTSFHTLEAFVHAAFRSASPTAAVSPLPVPATLAPLTAPMIVTNGVTRPGLNTDWILRGFFYAIAVGDYIAVRLYLELAQKSQAFDYLASDSYGLTCLHVACAFNRVRVLEFLKERAKIPVSMLGATTVKPITDTDSARLASFNAANRYLPYFRTQISLNLGSPCGAVACGYQSQGCLAFISRWLKDLGVQLQPHRPAVSSAPTHGQHTATATS